MKPKTVKCPATSSSIARLGASILEHFPAWHIPKTYIFLKVLADVMTFPVSKVSLRGGARWPKIGLKRHTDIIIYISLSDLRWYALDNISQNI